MLAQRCCSTQIDGTAISSLENNLIEIIQQEEEHYTVALHADEPFYVLKAIQQNIRWYNSWLLHVRAIGSTIAIVEEVTLSS